MNALYPAVADRAGHKCEYCRAPEQVFNFAFEVEHIHPRSRGGTDALNNLALACESCNLYKSNAVTGIDPTDTREAALFHPRWEQWSNHFCYVEATAELQGLTLTGRATIARLKLNSAFQMRARRQWSRLALYP